MHKAEDFANVQLLCCWMAKHLLLGQNYWPPYCCFQTWSWAFLMILNNFISSFLRELTIFLSNYFRVLQFTSWSKSYIKFGLSCYLMNYMSSIETALLSISNEVHLAVDSGHCSVSVLFDITAPFKRPEYFTKLIH